MAHRRRARWFDLAWFRFRNKYRDDAKTQRDWPQTFRNAVKGNWGDLWRIGADNGYFLTTAGKQLQAEAA